MSIQIVRSDYAQNYLILSNDIARDTRLSFKARGLHHYLLSLPPNWHTTTEQIGRENPEGRDAVRSAIHELIQFGYVTRMKYQNEQGHWQQRLIVHDNAVEPVPVEPATGYPASDKAAS